MTENDLLTAVLELCQLYGVRAAHFRPARTANGWRTPVAGDGKGFPDLVLVGPRGVLYRELKADGGRLRPEQEVWLAALRRAQQDAAVWYAHDLKDGLLQVEIRWLAGRGAA